MGTVPVNAGGLTVSVAPLAPDATESMIAPAPKATVRGALKARIAQAAICTEDISQISFGEYTVDWSKWMTAVASRWAVVFNQAYTSGQFRPDGPAFVQFTCNQDGTVVQAQVLSGSGDVLCDKAQVETLKNCVPLPQFPAGCKKKNITVLYVWDYGVDRRSIAKRAKPATHGATIPDQQRISITGKTM
jgi:TonB family protein